jgi:hypothetical protein
MKSPIKHKYGFDIHFKRGNDEKDWIDMEFHEFTFEEAYQKAMNWTRYISKAELREFDKKKVMKHTKEENRYYYFDDTKLTFVK